MVRSGNHGWKPTLEGQDAKGGGQPVYQLNEWISGVGRKIEDALFKPAGIAQHKGERVDLTEERPEPGKNEAIDLGGGKKRIEQGDVFHVACGCGWIKVQW